MLAARALFAFKVGERSGDTPAEPSEDALLGALLEVERRAVELQGWENFAKFAEIYFKSKRGRPGAGRGRRR